MSDQPTILSAEQISNWRSRLTAPQTPVATRREMALDLLQHALDSRDADISAFLAHLADADASLREPLILALTQAAEEQPDAAYAFLRARAPEAADNAWLGLLEQTARRALDIAVRDADSATLVQWLTLIAREPAHYQLGAALCEGFQLAQTRAYADPDLARELALLAARRVPICLEALFNDPDLMAALPNNFGRVLRDLDGDLMQLYSNRGNELFLIALGRAVQSRSGAMITPAVTAQLWDIHASSERFPLLPARYQPNHLLHQIIMHGSSYIIREAMDALYERLLNHPRDETMRDLFASGDELLLPTFLRSLADEHRSIKEIREFVLHLTSSGHLSPQQALDFYLSVLDEQGWREEYWPVTHEVARFLNDDVVVEPTALWQLLNRAATARDATVTRTLVRHLLPQVEKAPDEEALAKRLKKLSTQTRWDDDAREQVLTWWRAFLRRPGQSKAALYALDTALEAVRQLDEERAILHTLLSVRKVFTQRDMKTFALAIEMAYTLLDSLSDAFDPGSKSALAFDAETVRQELSQREDALPPLDQRLLANNLKELAHLIALMGDARTRNRLRGDEALDRDLMSGEQTPHSAVDALKWLSGYWGGNQDQDATE